MDNQSRRPRLRRSRRKKAAPSEPKLALKTEAEIARLREANQLVAEIFAVLQTAIEPGARLSDLDQLAEAHIKAKGAQTLYKGYRGSPPTNPPFPGVICASLNDEICHGIPNRRRLKHGDIIGIDIGLRYRDYCGDACVTFAVGAVSPQVQHLLAVTKTCLARGIAAAQPGGRLGDIGAAIQGHAEAEGFSVVREWGGHGIGKDLHEPPAVMHTGRAGLGMRIQPGMVFTIEPMINAGKPEWRLLRDGWTVVTRDKAPSAQFEHTIAITKDGPEVLSTLPDQPPAW